MLGGLEWLYALIVALCFEVGFMPRMSLMRWMCSLFVALVAR